MDFGIRNLKAQGIVTKPKKIEKTGGSDSNPATKKDNQIFFQKIL